MGGKSKFLPANSLIPGQEAPETSSLETVPSASRLLFTTFLKVPWYAARAS